ncbi:unnamed protein product [Closterium sp. Naga37s-1]|nr:unnamed protein product [Closterium sp. Naga37s-1]
MNLIAMNDKDEIYEDPESTEVDESEDTDDTGASVEAAEKQEEEIVTMEAAAVNGGDGDGVNTFAAAIVVEDEAVNAKCVGVAVKGDIMVKGSKANATAKGRVLTKEEHVEGYETREVLRVEMPRSSERIKKISQGLDVKALNFKTRKQRFKEPNLSSAATSASTSAATSVATSSAAAVAVSHEFPGARMAFTSDLQFVPEHPESPVPCFRVLDHEGGLVEGGEEPELVREQPEWPVPCFRVLDHEVGLVEGAELPELTPSEAERHVRGNGGAALQAMDSVFDPPTHNLYSSNYPLPPAFPQLTHSEAERMYQAMVELQAMDSVFYEAQRQGRFSFYMTTAGEEAVNVASAAAIHPHDHVFAQVKGEGRSSMKGGKDDRDEPNAANAAMGRYHRSRGTKARRDAGKVCTLPVSARTPPFKGRAPSCKQRAHRKQLSAPRCRHHAPPEPQRSPRYRHEAPL